MPMTIANVEMAEAWDGEEGDQWTEHADRYDATGKFIWPQFLGAVLIKPDDRALDIGCGTGQSTLDVAARAASVVGVDLSTRMLALARERATAQGTTNVEFIHGDAQVHPFEASSFDLAYSRYGAIFFNDRPAAFANIASALRPGGRLALLAWQAMERNPWLLTIRAALAAGRTLGAPPPGAPGPFGLADADNVRAVLGGAGFDDIALTEIAEPVYLGADPDDAWTYVSRLGIVKGLTETLDEPDRAAALATLRAAVDAHETDRGVLMGSGSWLITARRT